MLKIFLANPAPQIADGSLQLPMDEALTVTRNCIGHEDGGAATQVYLRLHMQAAQGQRGAFSASDLVEIARRDLHLVTPHQAEPFTLDELERGMRYLVELGVAIVAPPELRRV